MPYVMTSHPALSSILSFQQVAPVDVLGIAHFFKLTVWEKVLNKGISGMLLKDRDNGGESGYSVLVSAGDPLTRKRFTVAHEIAHFILHRDQIGDQLSDDVFYRSGLSTSQEVEANKMAADILMPYELIDRVQQSGVAGVDSLAKTFQVSRYAMMIRLGIPIP